ncbi:hypothetical protein P421_00180 [Heyndrickxia coagulans P38]|uniref:hypothetical protein n=1 Tax=Heyndrickxia coagulans TaxID=1398 RepID=UPI000552401F|nr:hypothetical protein [Heyndrickxia coagulans]KGT40042.1 hypothetical protein P421_00180 [Heyndrickxia coagulans P38]
MRWPYEQIGVTTARAFRNLLNKIIGDIGADMQEHKDRADNIQAQVDNLVADGDSSPEAAQARVGADGTNYTTLKQRLDAEHADVTTQLEDVTAQLAENTKVINRAKDKKVPLGGYLLPKDLNFKIKHKFRYFDLMPDKFIVLTDQFITNFNQFTTFATIHQLATPGVGNGLIQFTNSSDYSCIVKYNVAPAVPNVSSELTIKNFGGGTKDQDTVYIGLYKDESNYVHAWYNNRLNKVGFDAKVSGTLHASGIVSDIHLQPGVRIMFVLLENQVTLLSNDGNGWSKLSSWDLLGIVDFRDELTLSEYKYGFGVAGDAGTVISIDEFKGGYYGLVGVRDPNVVAWSDGVPYIKDNKLYLTMTCAGLPGGGGRRAIAAASFGVFTLDLTSYKLELIGKIYFKRNNVLMPDHAGNIVVDKDDGSFHVFISTWGDHWDTGWVNIGYGKTLENVFHGFNVIEDVQILNMQTKNSAYDPHALKINGEWVIGFIETTARFVPWGFFPSLVKGDLNNLVYVGGDRSVVVGDYTGCEGSKLQKIGDKWYLMAGQNTGDYRVYDLNMTYVTNLNVEPITPIPNAHPMVTPVPFRGKTKYIMPMFDVQNYNGDSTMGNFYVLEASETENGYEFPIRIPFT